MANGNFMDTGPVLILLSGLPGSGKTTFATRLAACLTFEHIESDAVRRSLAHEPAFTPAENARVFDRVEAEARRALEAGRHVLIDATNLTTRDRKRFVRLARLLAVRLIAVRLVAPEETIRDRLAAPRNGNSQAGIAIYERMRGRAQPFGYPSVVVDTRFELAPALALVCFLVDGRLDE